MTSYVQLSAALDAVGEVPCMLDPEVYFHDEDEPRGVKQKKTIRARALCQGCPIRLLCLDYAITNNETVGVWGGVSERERKGLKRGSIA